MNSINDAFGFLVEKLAPILFYQIYGFPLITLVLMFGGLVFTFYFEY